MWPMQNELTLFRKMQEGDWYAFNYFFESYSERLYSSPATTKICFERTINVSLSRYTQFGSAFATCLEINVFPQAGGDVTKINFFMYVPPFFSLSQSCLILAQLYDGSKK